MALFLLIAGMAAECAGEGKFTKLMAYHVFCDIDGDKLVAVMHGESVADEIGGDHGGAAPGLDDRLLAGLFHSCDFLLELDADERSFL